MIIDIKKGLLMLCSLKDGYNKVDIKVKYSEIASMEQDNVAFKIRENELIKTKPNLTLIVKDIAHTFWFHDLNAKKSALMCIQQIQRQYKAKKKASASSVHSPDQPKYDHFSYICINYFICS